MDVHIFTVPYDSGHKNLRMGAGPGRLLSGGLEQALHVLQVEQIDSQDPFPTEAAVSFGLYRQLAERVTAVRQAGRFPLVLGGNCGCSVGALAGASASKTAPGSQPGVIWLDAHGDFNTPETTTSGFLDGMALAVAAGLCWTNVTASFPGFRAVSPANIVHLGGRDFDPPEIELLRGSGAAVLDAPAIHAQGLQTLLVPALEKLRQRVERVHLHLDLDVLDPHAVAPANAYPAPGGLSVEQVIETLQQAAGRFDVISLTVASYDPAQDPDGRIVLAARQILSETLSHID